MKELSSWQIKRKHKKRLIENKVHKNGLSYRKKDGGKIKPLVKTCTYCHKRVVKYHHFLCGACYKIKKEVK